MNLNLNLELFLTQLAPSSPLLRRIEKYPTPFKTYVRVWDLHMR